jgi:small subunit ribosomal protein S9
MNATKKETPHKKPVVKKPVATRKPKAPTKPHAKPEVKHHEVKHTEPEAAPVAAAHKVPHGKNFYAVGRRKTSVAQVLVSVGNGTITINKLPLEGYFQTLDLQTIVKHPMVSIGVDKNLNVKTKVSGGGIHSQAEAVRHAISRALLGYNPESRRTLKKLGFLTRDPRVKERKKPGLKRARRAPQFSKR